MFKIYSLPLFSTPFAWLPTSFTACLHFYFVSLDKSEKFGHRACHSQVVYGSDSLSCFPEPLCPVCWVWRAQYQSGQMRSMLSHAAVLRRGNEGAGAVCSAMLCNILYSIASAFSRPLSLAACSHSLAQPVTASVLWWFCSCSEWLLVCSGLLSPQNNHTGTILFAVLFSQ